MSPLLLLPFSCVSVMHCTSQGMYLSCLLLHVRVGVVEAGRSCVFVCEGVGVV